jgi:phage terminase large subunit
MIQVTTALRKISGLRKKIKGIQGGQGAGKTFAILILLINHASSNPNKEIYVVSAELSKMRDTVIKDFLKIISTLPLKIDLTGFNSGSPKCIFQNGSFIRFIGLDKEDVGKGLRSDVIFVNEANKTNFDTYRELTSRAKQIFIDFNPNRKFWFHTEVMPRDDCNFIKLTYKDNEQISDAEMKEILSYKAKGFNENGQVINQYWANMWRVYGLGEVGQVEGRIYQWQPIPLEKYLTIQKETYYGCDWGKVDPFAVVEGKYHDGNLYVHELNYASENEIERNLSPTELHQIKAGDFDLGDGEMNEGLIGWLFAKMGVNKNKIIVCDSNRPNKIRSLRNAGWEYAVSVRGKPKLEDRVFTLSGLNIYYTSCSNNIEAEQENYCYGKVDGVLQEKPIDQDNHTMDAIAYMVDKMFEIGVIKNI